MTNSVSPPALDPNAVVGTVQGAVDGLDHADAAAGLVPHPRPHRVPAGAPLLVAGWALDAVTGGEPLAVRLVVDGARAHAAETGVSRRDVARGLADCTCETVGYRAVVPTDGLPSGGHQLRAYALDSGGTWSAAGVRGFVTYEPVRPGLAPSARTVQLRVDQVVDLAPDGAIAAFARPVPLGHFVMLSGWALDVASRAGPPAVCAFDERNNRWSAPCDTARPDIAALVGAADARLGFEILIPARALGTGRHTVDVAAVDGEGRRSAAAVRATFDVVAELRDLTPYAVERRQLPVFAARIAPAPGAGGEAAAVRASAGARLAVPRGTSVRIDGWALAESGAPATQVYVELREPQTVAEPRRYPAPAGFRNDHPPRELAAPPADGAWFTCSLDTQPLRERTYRIDLVVAQSGGRAFSRAELGALEIEPCSRT